LFSIYVQFPKLDIAVDDRQLCRLDLSPPKLLIYRPLKEGSLLASRSRLAKSSLLQPVILMILFCVEIGLIGETVEADDKPEKQRKCQVTLYIAAKILFAK
jgi:hypothetical protein